MSITKRGGAWVVRKQSNGHRCHLSYRSYDEACKVNRLLEEKICNPIDIQPITLKQAYEKCIAEAGHRGRPLKYQASQAKKNVEYFKESCLLTDITQERIGEYRAFLSGQPLSNGTRNRRIASLKKVISWAIGKAYIKKPLAIPTFREGSKVYSCYTQDEIQKLFVYCETNEVEREITLLLYILFATGMRVGECLTLDIENDYDKEKGYFIIRESKNGDQRKVPASRALKTILSEVTQDVLTRFNRLKYEQAQYRINKTFKSVFPYRKDATIHLIRHTVATVMVSKMNVVYVQKILGHRQLKTTARYTHPSNDDLQKAIDRCDLHIT